MSRVYWSNGRFFAGQAEVGNTVAMSLRQWAARRAKDEAEIENARDRARTLQSRAVPSGDAPASFAAPKASPKTKKLGAGTAAGGDK